MGLNRVAAARRKNSLFFRTAGSRGVERVGGGRFRRDLVRGGAGSKFAIGGNPADGGAVGADFGFQGAGSSATLTDTQTGRTAILVLGAQIVTNSTEDKKGNDGQNNEPGLGHGPGYSIPPRGDNCKFYGRG